MSKMNPQPASAQCRIFIVRGGGKVGSWEHWIAEALRANGNLTGSLSNADAVLVVIGRSGLAGMNSSARGLIKVAFEQGKPVVPILVDDARMPGAQRLPADLREFSYQQAVTITSRGKIPGAMARVIAAYRPQAGPRRKPLDAARRSKRGERVSVLPSILQTMQPYVFICYRRDDSAYWANPLARELASKVGGDHVFLDVGSQQPGRDYRRQIDEALARCTHFVVIIGPGFLEPDVRGVRRIDTQRDEVRREIRTALSAQKRIHVVLTSGVDMPNQRDLPADISRLADSSSISRLRSDTDAGTVAVEIVGMASSTRSANPANNVVDEWMLEQQSLQRVAEWVVAKLEGYGWNVSSQEYDWGKIFTLGHAQYPQFRFVVKAKEAEVALQEQVRSARRLGMPRWVARSIFPISPHTYVTEDMLQLPDSLLEAALDPNQYLDRTGRIEVSVRKRRKFMSQNSFLKNVKLLADENPSAVEAYQQTRRGVSARGGLASLTPLGQVRGLPQDDFAVNAAFHPDGSGLAVISDSGLHLVSARDWRTGESIRIGGSVQSVAYSPQGRLAVGTEKGRLWAWDSDGFPIEASATPHSLFKRTLGDEKIAFKSVSWSDSGEALACCGGEAVWFYRPAARQWSSWEFPERKAINMYYGACFIRGRNELLVYGLFHCLWVVQFPSLRVRRALELEKRPGHLDRLMDSKRGRETSPGPAFSDIYVAEPNPSGDLAACAGSHGQVAVYALSSMSQVTSFAWHEPFWRGIESSMRAVSFSPDGKWLAAVGGDGKLVVGNTRTWEPEREARVHDLPVSEAKIAWSPDSTTIALTVIGRVQLWRL
jgi:hypothetical protein